MLGGAPREPKLEQRGVQLGVPGTWGLAKTVECLGQVEHLVFMPLEHEPEGLLDVDILQQLAIEKRRLDIHVVH